MATTRDFHDDIRISAGEVIALLYELARADDEVSCGIFFIPVNLYLETSTLSAICY